MLCIHKSYVYARLPLLSKHSVLLLVPAINTLLLHFSVIKYATLPPWHAGFCYITFFYVTRAIRIGIILLFVAKLLGAKINCSMTFHALYLCPGTEWIFRNVKLAGYSILDIGHSNVQCPILNIRLTSRSLNIPWIINCYALMLVKFYTLYHI